MRNVSDNEWMPAIVPGSVFKDLLANNAIKLYCANETMQSHDCVINCRLLKYDGTVIFDKSAIANYNHCLPKNITALIYRNIFIRMRIKEIFMQNLNCVRMVKLSAEEQKCSALQSTLN